jgi:trans-2,3-dihydro-3-hydroxyanthranilate isomerase
MRRRFVTLDVFTATRFAGNPLAVVLESDGLEKEDMQAIAAEFNLAETVFMRPPANPDHRASLRIFTPKAELPFAGHPTIGTAVLLGCMSGYSGRPHHLVLEEIVGVIHCAVTAQGKDRGHASFVLPRLPEGTQGAADRDAIAAALKLQTGDIGFGHYAPAVWSAGVPVTCVPVSGLEAIARAAPDAGRFAAAFGGSGPGIAYLFCEEVREEGHHFHGRMFAPALGVPEDPATGAAAAAFAGMIAQSRGLPDGEHAFVIEQGYEMGRPSQIELGLTMQDGVLARASIGGAAVLVSDGNIMA